MPLAEENFHALLSLSNIMLDNGSEQHWKQARIWLQKAEQLQAQSIARGSTAQLYYLKGRWWEATGNPDKAQQWYRLAYRTWPDPANSALGRLEQYPGTRPALCLWIALLQTAQPCAGVLRRF